MRFHCVALPHTTTSKLHNACAYTQKVFNFCKMMHERGHTVYHYGAEGSDPPCTEHIQIVSRQEQFDLLGDHDWKSKMYNLKWDSNEPYWKLCNYRAVAEITKRQQSRDFVCLIGGTCQRPIAVGVDQSKLVVVEYGIGYSGTFARFKCYESYAHRHRLHGEQKGDADGDNYGCVIPNYYDLNDFPFVEHKQDYFLFIGRLIQRKGVAVAVEVTKDIGAKLLIAGQGVVAYEPGKLVTEDGKVYTGEHIEYVGFADIPTRAVLMGNARAVLVPTQYIGPFEGVNVEAQLCGTPVITTDWGCFAETVEHGVTGYRCRTHEQFCWSAKNAHRLDPATIRARAARRYSLDKVGAMFEEYFYQVSNLWEQGYYQPNPDRAELDWLRS